MDNLIKSQPSHLKLYKSGRIITTLNFPVDEATFYASETVPLPQLDPDKVSILLFGKFTFYLSLSDPFRQDIAVEPGTLTMGMFSYTFMGDPNATYGLEGGYIYENNEVQFGYFSFEDPSGTLTFPLVPDPPYQQPELNYFIFTY